MKVVLTSDVKGLGKKLDVVEVSEGYAKNYLIPKKIVKIANDKLLLEVKVKKESLKFKEETNREAALHLKKQIEELVLEFKLKTHENGKLFGSVTSKEISEELKKKSSIEIEKKKIQLDSVIKSSGTYIANIKLYEGVVGNLKIKVIGE